MQVGGWVDANCRMYGRHGICCCVLAGDADMAGTDTAADAEEGAGGWVGG
jgi:hypothetical protein